MVNLLRRWWPSLLMLAAIFILSSTPGQELPRFGSVDFYVKKFAHGLGYGLLAVAFWYGLRWDRRFWWLAIVLAFAYSITDEFHQSFVPGRHPSPVDVLIDTTGSAVMIGLFALVRWRRSRKQS